MSPDEYKTRAEYMATPAGRAEQRETKAARTDRQVIDETEGRVVRIETRLSHLLVKLGLNADGTAPHVSH